MRLRYRVATNVHTRPVVGSDSCILEVPDGVYVQIGGERVIVSALLGGVLRSASRHFADLNGEVLHHADWVMTSDPAVVEEVGMHGRPDCATCRAGVDQAVVALAEHKQDLLVGVLYWAGPAG